MKYISIFFLILISQASTVYAAPELKGSPQELKGFLFPEDKTVQISANAEETAYTDIAKVNLIVKTKTKLLAQSLKQNADLRSKIRDQLMSKGLAKDSIKNAKFSTSPDYGWFGSQPDSFEVENRVTITINDESQLRAIAELVDSRKEISLSSTEFEHSKKKEFEKKVKEKALNEILEKKEFYENSLGIKLTAVSFSESNVHFGAVPQTRIREQQEEVLVMSSRSAASDSYLSKNSTPKSSSFDEVKYSVRMFVQFKVD